MTSSYEAPGAGPGPAAHRGGRGKMNVAMRLAEHLVSASQWFECTPLPGDVFHFTIKADYAPHLDAYISSSLPPHIGGKIRRTS